MIEDEKVCPKGMPQQLLSQISERRSHAVVAAQSCEYVLSQIGGDRHQCSYGVTDDHISCGKFVCKRSVKRPNTDSEHLAVRRIRWRSHNR